MRFTVAPADSTQLDAACRLLAGLRPPADRDRAANRYRDLFTSGELDPAGLFVATDGRSIRGAVLMQAMSGALGLAWPPVTESRRNRTIIEDALVAATCNWLRSRGVKVCQAFAGELERDSMAALERHGFRRVTKLIDFQRELDAVEAPDSHLTFEPIGPANHDAFTKALLASFEGSLDCPEVSGSRTDAELLDSYTDAGTPHDHWFVVRKCTHHTPRDVPLAEREDDTTIGVVLLAGANNGAIFELTYVGVAPKFRGRGLGSELVKFALQHAKKARAQTLVLSVDERNEPALRLYKTRQFQASGEREVFLAHWPPIS